MTREQQMSDDQWRQPGARATRPVRGVRRSAVPGRGSRAAAASDDTGERRLRFGPNDTGPLPHWTDPPTGEVPRLAPRRRRRTTPATTRSTCGRRSRRSRRSGATTSTRIRRKDPSGGFRRDPSGRSADPSGGFDRDLTGEVRADALSEPMSRPPSGEIPIAAPPRREPGRITIGTDPSGVERRPPAGRSRRGAASPTRSGRPAGPARTSGVQPPPRRNLPAAIGAGLVLGGLFVIASLWRPVGVVALVTVVLAIAGFEYFGKVTEKGYRPAVAPGLAACVAAPLVAYWVGDGGLPLVVAFAFIAGAVGFIGASGVESGPLPNMAVTTMGVVWIGLLGSFAALIVRWSRRPAAPTTTSAPTPCS